MIFCFLLSCNSKKKDQKLAESKSTNADSLETEQMSVAEKIAEAHGIAHWEKVQNVGFTFNVDVDGNHSERSWKWKPKTNDVTMISGNDTISYNRKSIDSTSLNADRGFINDKFWLLAPFQLVWDSDTEISDATVVKAPISNEALNKITLTYTGNGGYTPGDAYDFYYSDDFIIQEWVYRKGNTKEPSLATTFENYETFDGLKIAKDHKQKDKDWNLYFTDIKVEK